MSVLNEYFNAKMSTTCFSCGREYLITHANFSRHMIYLRLSWFLFLTETNCLWGAAEMKISHNAKIIPVKCFTLYVDSLGNICRLQWPLCSKGQ